MRYVNRSRNGSTSLRVLHRRHRVADRTALGEQDLQRGSNFRPDVFQSISGEQRQLVNDDHLERVDG